MQVDETIVAIASSHDAGGLRGIVRVSGPDAVAAVSDVFHDHASQSLSSVKTAQRIPGFVTVPEPIGRIPGDLYLWPTNRSYTRQPTAEFHTYGSTPLLNAITEMLCRNGARIARPGEFTLRAFLAGRIDLSQAEAVLGVIDAIDQRELNVALEQLAGGLAQPLFEVRNALLNLCADLEAGLDFVEDDIEFISQEQVAQELSAALTKLEQVERQMKSRTLGTQLPRVVLRGEPNAGKSSLWNELCGGKAEAIVTDTAGTTRDYLVGNVSCDGFQFQLIDTAGIEQGQNALSSQLRAITDHQSDRAELLLLCIDSSRPLTDWERTELRQSGSEHTNVLVVFTKADLAIGQPRSEVNVGLKVFVQDPESFRRLAARCAEELKRYATESNVVANTASRCLSSIRRSQVSIRHAWDLCSNSSGEELVAADIRNALDELGQVVGAVYSEEVLDRIFSRFCIGK